MEMHTIEAVYVDAGAMWTDAVYGNGTLVGVGQVNYLVPGNIDWCLIILIKQATQPRLFCER